MVFDYWYIWFLHFGVVVHATVLTGNSSVLPLQTKEAHRRDLSIGVIIIIFLFLAQQWCLESLIVVTNMKSWAQTQKRSIYQRVYRLDREGAEESNM